MNAFSQLVNKRYAQPPLNTLRTRFRNLYIHTGTGGVLCRAEHDTKNKQSNIIKAANIAMCSKNELSLQYIFIDLVLLHITVMLHFYLSDIIILWCAPTGRTKTPPISHYLKIKAITASNIHASTLKFLFSFIKMFIIFAINFNSYIIIVYNNFIFILRL